MIRGCEKCLELRRPVTFYNALIRQVVMPNVVTYIALVRACERGKGLRWAVNVCDVRL